MSPPPIGRPSRTRRPPAARPRPPRRAAEATGAVFIGDDTDGRYAAYLCELGLDLGPESFRLCSESSLISWALARQGLGICPVMPEIARTMPELVQVLEEVPAITFPIWLLTHREVHTARRIRLVFDILAEELGGITPRLLPATLRT